MSWLMKRVKIFSHSGFTLVELILIILLLSIISAVAIPKFFNANDYQVRAAYDETANAVRYGQKLAVASGCEVQVLFSASGYALQQHASSCASGSFATISTQHPFSSASFSDVSISSSPNSFIFDTMGRSSSSVAVTIGSYSFSVVPETGYVDAL